MKRLVTKTALDLRVPLAGMLPPIATAATPLGRAPNAAKPTEPKHVRCMVTIAGYYRITVPFA
jgi:hypothetical protein